LTILRAQEIAQTEKRSLANAIAKLVEEAWDARIETQNQLAKLRAEQAKDHASA
jgi:hypothetical protein